MAETFSVADGLGALEEPGRRRPDDLQVAEYYVTNGGTFLSGDLQIAKLLAAGPKGLGLLPRGKE